MFSVFSLGIVLWLVYDLLQRVSISRGERSRSSSAWQSSL
jgi:hypothetical protein